MPAGHHENPSRHIVLSFYELQLLCAAASEPPLLIHLNGFLPTREQLERQRHDSHIGTPKRIVPVLAPGKPYRGAASQARAAC